MSGLAYGPDWGETLTLEDGARLRLRPLTPGDRGRVAEGFRRLSPESRYYRCLRARRELSDAELVFLTECDGIDHFAIAALALDGQGREAEGAGLARFVRCLDAPASAEIALTVADDWQGRGLGTRLLGHLLTAMSERGYREARGVMHAENQGMRRLLEALPEPVPLERDGSLLRFGVPVTPTRQTPMLPPLAADAVARVTRLLRLAATGAIGVPGHYALERAEALLADWVPELEEFRERLAWIAGDTGPRSEEE